MSEKYLKSLIDKLNKGKTNGLIHLRSLSESVDFAKVWLKAPKKSDSITSPDEPYSFYFIKNEEGVYVAAVLDMSNDLHWFVQRKYRKKGYLTSAMRQVILPHLFQDRDSQRITIEESQIGQKNYLSSKRVAIQLGFVEGNDEGEFYITSDKVNRDVIWGEDRLFSADRLEQLKREVNYLGKSLWLIQSEVEMNLGESDFTRKLLNLAREVRSSAIRLEDNWRASKEDTV